MNAATARAYEACAAITREQARNFYYGIRLLPADRRGALCAVYALARRIDDIGDGDLPHQEKRAELDHARADLRAIGELDDPVFVALSDAASRYPIALSAFDELIDGVEMDLVGRRYADFDELVTYCRAVAGSIGRLCLGVFGGPQTDDESMRYADVLGIALQQTNILRDIREDLGNGRVYLPKADLDRFGVTLTLDDRGALSDPDGALAALIRDSAERAETWYAEGLLLCGRLDRRAAACTAAMSGIYHELLRRIRANPAAVYDRRLSLPAWRKAGVAASALAGLAAGVRP